MGTLGSWGKTGVEDEGPGEGRKGKRVPGAHSEAGHQGALQEAHENIAPVVLVVRYTGVAHIEGEGHQEELHRGPQQPRPLPAEPRLHIELRARGRP